MVIKMVSKISIIRITLLGAILVFLAASIGVSEQAPEVYKVGPEDVINILVARHPEFSGDYYVPSDGIINLPAIGQVSLSGKTLNEISVDITERLRKRLREPEVTVALKTARMQRVYVLGAVEKPGLYDMKPGWRITEAMAAAGGLTNGTEPADCRANVLKAATNERKTYELKEVLNGTPESNIRIDSGDVLTIETGETMPIYVMGRVKNPGVYKLRQNIAGVMEAITLAGGTLDDASLSRVTITHTNGSSEVIDLTATMLEGKQGLKVSLKPADMIMVPEETSRVAVLGFVNEPGFYPMKYGKKLTLTDALGLAKGVNNKQGEVSAIAVIRNENGKQVRMVVNLAKFLKSGDVSQNPEIISGDVVYVPASKRLDWDRIISSLGAIGILMNPFIP